jgi:hypothetical protein
MSTLIAYHPHPIQKNSTMSLRGFVYNKELHARARLEYGLLSRQDSAAFGEGWNQGRMQ